LSAYAAAPDRSLLSFRSSRTIRSADGEQALEIKVRAAGIAGELAPPRRRRDGSRRRQVADRRG
jgi:hypothetical protein